MLQNRVDPYGNIIKNPARGHWTGNRGVIHDEHKNILRRFKLKAWITCALQFKGWKREVMSPNRWTELFFWDEATAFSAGHRPCFFCRRPDANRFKVFWLKGNSEYGFDAKTRMPEIDKVIHRERIDEKGLKVTYLADITSLPDGCFIELNDKPWLIFEGLIYPWSPTGYGKGELFHKHQQVKVLTPGSIVKTFSAGYKPEMIF